LQDKKLLIIKENKDLFINSQKNLFHNGQVLNYKVGLSDIVNQMPFFIVLLNLYFHKQEVHLILKMKGFFFFTSFYFSNQINKFQFNQHFH